MPTKTSTTDAAPMVIALTTIHLEGGVITKGDQLPADDPQVRGRGGLFAPADTAPQELRRLESELFADAVRDAWQPPAPQAPIKMKARRAFVAEVVTTTNRDVAAGEVFMSDSEIFMDYARFFEPVRESK